MLEGPLEALDQIKKATKEEQCNVIGYCLGGTLLTTLLAYLKVKKQDSRIKSTTFLTTLIDFEEAGDLKLFMDEGQIENMIDSMSKKGVARSQRTTTNLRPAPR